MITVKRVKNEDVKSFIKRACRVRVAFNEDVLLDFRDGNVLKTSDYENLDTIENELVTIYRTIKSYEGINIDEEDVPIMDEEDIDEMSDETMIYEENVHEDDVILEDENLNEVNDIVKEHQDNPNQSQDIFAENIQDEDLSLMENVETITFEENLSSDDKEQDLIPMISLESLHLLTEVAIKDGNYSKIDIEKRKDIEKELEKARQTYKEMFEEKQRQAAIINKEINDSVSERKRQIDEEIKLIVSQKQEYSRLIEEFKIELANLEDGYSKLREKLEKGEFSQDVVDMVNKSKILEDKNVKSSELLEFIPVEELKHIYKLKWNVEAYQEYLDFFYTAQYPDRVKSSIETLKTASIESKEEFKELMIKAFPNAKIGEDGKIDYNIERDDPDLAEMRDYISKLEERVNDQDKHPAVIEDKILSMMYERKSSDEIAPLLDELMSNVKNNLITGVFESDKERLESVNIDIIEANAKLENLNKLIIEDEPLNEDLINIDNIRIERLRATSERLADEIDECDIVLAKKDNKARIKNLNQAINKYNMFMLKNLKEKTLYVLDNGENENDPQIAIFNQNIEFSKKTLSDLKELRKELRAENKNNKLFMTVKQAESKKEKLLAEKERVDKSIDELELAKQEKIDNGKYIDTTIVNERKQEIIALEEELDFLGNLKIALNKYTTESLKNNILNYNNPEYFTDKDLDEEEIENNLTDTVTEEVEFEENINDEVFKENLPNQEKDENEFEEIIHEDDLEEIVEEKPAKKGLLSLIKSNKFKKIAVAAMAVIVTGVIALTGMVAHNRHKEAKEKDELKQIAMELENTTENTKVPEKMESVAEVQKEKIEEEKENNKPQNIVDTSRIATTAEAAAKGNFLTEDKIYKERFDDKMIEDIIDMEANGETVYMVVGENGVPIGYTDQVNEIEQTGKVR